MQKTLYTYLDSSPSPASTDGALSGVSIAIQPNMSVRGWPTAAGSKALEGFTAIFDATAIERLKQAGAHIKAASA